MEYSAKECDAIVIALKPTVACLRDASRVCSQLRELQTKARIIIVINHTAPEKNMRQSRGKKLKKISSSTH
ncbi:hypothetical protein QW180_02050 [Vibrio sinaloensis]|nr:hypothetical protein [Vibrio sinaloensis]